MQEIAPLGVANLPVAVLSNCHNADTDTLIITQIRANIPTREPVLTITPVLPHRQLMVGLLPGLLLVGLLDWFLLFP